MALAALIIAAASLALAAPCAVLAVLQLRDRHSARVVLADRSDPKESSLEHRDR
jgi:hypothetical protein